VKVLGIAGVFRFICLKRKDLPKSFLVLEIRGQINICGQI